MSDEDLDLMRRWFDAWNRTDLDAFADLFDADAELITDPSWMEAGPFEGRGAIRAWYEGLKESWGGRDTVALRELFEAEDRVVARLDWQVRGRTSGIEMELDATSVNTIKSGRIVRQQWYFDHAEALEAVGLKEEAVSQPNVEVVRRIYELGTEQWSGREGGGRRSVRDRARELWDPELVVEENAAFPDRAIYRGYEGLARWWRSFYEVYDDLRIEPREFIPVGDAVVVQAHHWLRSKMGVTLERDITHVWTLRDGRAVHVTGYMDRAEALEAVGLEE